MNELKEAQKFANESVEKEQFITAVMHGLDQVKKCIPSRFLYDSRGSELFNQITRHPDYYLTNCELDILHKHKASMLRFIDSNSFNLIDLGPGEGIKTTILLEHFLQQKHKVSYYPIDISSQYLNDLSKIIHRKLPSVLVKPVHAEYINGLRWLKHHAEGPNVVLFLGSSIGNYTPSQTLDFMKQLHAELNPGDFLLIGFDMRKDISVLMRAYDDSDGITNEFNFNLLKRINRELQADFVLEHFKHYPTYNVYTGAMESYLISQKAQTISFSNHYKCKLEAFEPIHTEFSYKYLLSQINDFSHQTGFKILEHFQDDRKYFLDSLWQVN